VVKTVERDGGMLHVNKDGIVSGACHDLGNPDIVEGYPSAVDYFSLAQTRFETSYSIKH
jgi:hypothetical protein